MLQYAVPEHCYLWMNSRTKREDALRCLASLGILTAGVYDFDGSIGMIMALRRPELLIARGGSSL